MSVVKCHPWTSETLNGISGHTQRVCGCVGQVSPPGQGLSVWEGHEGEPSGSEWQRRQTVPVCEHCQGFSPYVVLKNTWWGLNGIFKSVARADAADRTNRNLGKSIIDICYFFSEWPKAVEPLSPEYWQLFSFESLTSCLWPFLFGSHLFLKNTYCFEKGVQCPEYKIFCSLSPTGTSVKTQRSHIAASGAAVPGRSTPGVCRPRTGGWPAHGRGPCSACGDAFKHRLQLQL